MNSRHWVFVKEDDFRKDCPAHQGSKDAFLPVIHHGTPNANPKKRLGRLPKGATLLSKHSKAEKAFLEEVEAKSSLHPLALCPLLKEALPAEVICLGLREGLLGALKQFSADAQEALGYLL